MATTLRTQNLTDYDARLLELAHQLDAERREIIMQFAQDLLLIPYEPDSEFSDLTSSSRFLH
jgi:hypothetical protein